MHRVADYVVVGAGSAGCIVARRLADTGASVLLIEAGRRDNTQLVRKPGMIGPLHSVPQLKKTVDWGHYTTPQAGALGRRIPQTHGKVVGGSSSINGMVFVRGNRQNFDDWAAEGNTGWSYEDVLPSFKKFESFEDGGRGAQGHTVSAPSAVRSCCPWSSVRLLTACALIAAGCAPTLANMAGSASGATRFSVRASPMAAMTRVAVSAPIGGPGSVAGEVWVGISGSGVAS